jgi:hypothetical protein
MLYIDEESRNAGQSGDIGLEWWATPYGTWRLAAETEAMHRFPQFRLQACGGTLAWDGSLVSALYPGASYRIRLTYPSRYPDEPPEVEIVAPELDLGTPHLLPLNRPCLFWHNGPGNGYEPARTTAATMIAWTALWIHAYETWQQTGDWPGRGV